MRIITWNVNGIKPLVHYHPWNQKRTYEGIMEDLGGDIICIQESKITRAQMIKEMACMSAFDSFYSFYRRLPLKGIHGTAIFTKRETVVPVKAEEGIGSCLFPSDMAVPARIGGYPLSSEVDMDYNTMKDLDQEGRTTVIDCGLFVLINLYCPNETNSERLVFKNHFNAMVDRRVRNLIKAGREVIVVGDLNICADDLDTSEPAKRARERGLENFTDHPPRAWLRDFVGPDGPMIDITRRLHPNRLGMFTCWETKIEARKTNYGTRLDYILITPALLPWVKDSNIQPEVMGSDHCPVFVDFHDEIEDPVRGILKLKDLLNPGRQPGDKLPDPPSFAARFYDEFSGKQQTLQSWFGKKSETPAPKPSASPSPALPATEASVPPAPSSSVRTASSSQEAARSSSTGGSKKTKVRSQSPVEQPKKVGQQDLSSFFKPPAKPERPKKKRKKSKTGSPPPSSSSETGKTVSRSSSRPKPSPSPAASISRDKNDREILVLDDDDDDADHQENGGTQDSLDAEAEARASATAEAFNMSNGTANKWSEIFAAKPTPLCEGHNEPSRLWTVNKPGVNKGRVFYLCARPVGPGYDRGQAKINVDPQYRCNFFQWDTNVKRPAGMVLSSAAKRQKN
ncbi:hypothetical protein JCM10908_004011 [Rhodotorula pacifica]|uniref:uncharacterized protein n=1 Tax=Rhodotorula pacifica TaxID=1495444 RepID=UPI00317B9306